ncbi:putative aminotransferase family protein [Xylariomycetidae sp. FL0641]|nr:putative aminotransferase family protein [Xylariomycetidae sp. FL0641]
MSPSTPFGAAMRRAHFAFAPSYTPLNHGSYGYTPTPVRDAHRSLQAEADAAPDPFIALDRHPRMASARAATARVLRCDVDELVLVPNATTGIDTVLKNLDWRPGDVVLCYEVVYDAVRRGLAWLEERHGLEVHCVPVQWPASDDALVDAGVAAARRINATEGKRLRLAVVDTVVSMPGLRVPFERLTPALQAEGAMVVVDGAHGIGHIDLDLGRLRPDFFVSNLHKWFFVPRGCAAFFVRRDRQPLIRTSLPTSHGFCTREELEQGADPKFIEMFDFTGTADTTNYLCVDAAANFRDRVCGGEEAIRSYCHTVAQQGAAVAAEILGTEIMDCPGSCLRDCNFANVRLPLEVLDAEDGSGAGKVDPKHAATLVKWLKTTAVKESGMYFQTCLYRGAFWWRLSGMIYLEVDDFRKGAEVLKALCERVKKGEHISDTVLA